MLRKEGENFVKKILSYTFSITIGLGILAGIVISLILLFTREVDTIHVDNLQPAVIGQEIKVYDKD